MHHTFAEARIQGYLGKDPKADDKLMRMSLAYSIPRKEEESLSKWVDVTMFKSAPGFDWLKDNLSKGDLVTVQASIENTSYEKDGETQYGMSVIAKSVSLIPRNSSDD